MSTPNPEYGAPSLPITSTLRRDMPQHPATPGLTADREVRDLLGATHTPYLAVAHELPTGWRITVLDSTAGRPALVIDRADWDTWRPASAGHRLIEHCYMVHPGAHFEDGRTAGWALLPSGRWTAPVRTTADVLGERDVCVEHGQEEEREQAAERTAILIVDRHSSRCSACKRLTFTVDTHHTRLAGTWNGADDESEEPGCGARYVAIRAAVEAVTPEILNRIRPDLPLA
ncbi:hypothetical protein [Streptomyces sp. NPDC094049]|uniref:hypothetical protein n=1 Tax=Streptomyces sp. NPDC094049 TaxID=3154987 RepID=UPI003332B0A0